MVLSFAKLQISVFSVNRNILFKKILNNKVPRIDPCGTLKKFFNRDLKLKSSLTLWKLFKR